MTAWHIQETRNLIDRLFGREQLERAGPSLSSVVDRQWYAHYHYHEAIDLLEQHIDTRLADTSLLHIILGEDDEERTELDRCLTKVGANVVACVQSIHAGVDIAAHAVYFSLGINLLPSPLSETSISLGTVSARAKLYSEFAPVTALLGSLGSGTGFTHIAALANHSKHRSIIRPSLVADMTGSVREPYQLKFEPFIYKGVSYPETPVRTLLQAEYNRCSVTVIDIGNAINAVLRSKTP